MFLFPFSFILIPIEIEDGIFPFARRWIYRSKAKGRLKGVKKGEQVLFTPLIANNRRDRIPVSADPPVTRAHGSSTYNKWIDTARQKRSGTKGDSAKPTFFFLSIYRGGRERERGVSSHCPSSRSSLSSLRLSVPPPIDRCSFQLSTRAEPRADAFYLVPVIKA